MPGKHKQKRFLASRNNFIRNYMSAYKYSTIKIVEGYIDPQVMPTSGLHYKGIKEIVVGELFLLGKIF